MLCCDDATHSLGNGQPAADPHRRGADRPPRCAPPPFGAHSGEHVVATIETANVSQMIAHLQPVLLVNEIAQRHRFLQAVHAASASAAHRSNVAKLLQETMLWAQKKGHIKEMDEAYERCSDRSVEDTDKELLPSKIDAQRAIKSEPGAAASGEPEPTAIAPMTTASAAPEISLPVGAGTVSDAAPESGARKKGKKRAKVSDAGDGASGKKKPKRIVKIKLDGASSKKAASSSNDQQYGNVDGYKFPDAAWPRPPSMPSAPLATLFTPAKLAAAVKKTPDYLHKLLASFPEGDTCTVEWLESELGEPAEWTNFTPDVFKQKLAPVAKELKSRYVTWKEAVDKKAEQSDSSDSEGWQNSDSPVPKE